MSLLTEAINWQPWDFLFQHHNFGIPSEQSQELPLPKWSSDSGWWPFVSVSIVLTSGFQPSNVSLFFCSLFFNAPYFKVLNIHFLLYVIYYIFIIDVVFDWVWVTLANAIVICAGTKKLAGLDSGQASQDSSQHCWIPLKLITIWKTCGCFYLHSKRRLLWGCFTALFTL